MRQTEFLRKCLLFMLAVFCMIFSACGQKQNQGAQPSKTQSTLPPIKEEAVVKEPEPEIKINTNEDKWKEKALKYTFKKGGVEYYFDTESPVSIGDDDDFPLYKRDAEGNETYTGITGYSFFAYGKYLYVESNIVYGDYGHWQTRVLSLDNGTVYQAAKDSHIYIPSDGKNAYYTKTYDQNIYISDAAMQKKPKTVKIVLPDWKEILQKTGFANREKELRQNITVLNVKKGWIDFQCAMDDVLYDTVYRGNYSIRTNGKNIKKKDAGEIFQIKED